MTAVVGRERELAAVAGPLADGRSRVVGPVLEGEAGIGKTTIWRAAVERASAEGFLVLAARPAEAEAQVALSALEELVVRATGRRSISRDRRRSRRRGVSATWRSSAS